MLRDYDLVQFRQTYYRLFVKLFWKEPEAAFIAGLQDDDAQTRTQAAAAVHPLMGDGWQVIEHYLADHQPDEVATEYGQLFLEPFAKGLRPYASYYLTGQFFTEPLKTWRAFLRPLGVEKPTQGFTDPEDVLAFELDVMRWLIDKQAAAEDIDPWLRPAGHLPQGAPAGLGAELRGRHRTGSTGGFLSRSGKGTAGLSGSRTEPVRRLGAGQCGNPGRSPRTFMERKGSGGDRCSTFQAKSLSECAQSRVR